jgi:hypothetical protein
MEFRNTALYNKLRECIKDKCKDSLSWRPHTTKYQTLIESILAEEIVRRNMEWWAPDRPIAKEAAAWVERFLEGYQEETQNGLVWNAEAFDRLFFRLEEFLYQDPYPSHFISPLNPFSCDSSIPIELETDIRIRRPDDFLINILRNQELNIEYSPDAADWVVDIVIEQPKTMEREGVDGYTSKANKKLRMVLQSLRLLHQGKVFVGPLYYLIHPPFAGFKRNIGALLDTGLTTLPLTHLTYLTLACYQLDERELEELRTIYRTMAKESNHYPDSLALALSRFHDYFSRIDELDGLLDLVIALEALFAAGSQEIKHSLARRCSYFLEPDLEKQKILFSRLSDIYDIRSFVVHGRTGLPKKWRKLRGQDYDVALASIVADAEECVRQAVRKIIAERHLDKLKNPTHWGKYLDNLV